jgi:hypothetical protein
MRVRCVLWCYRVCCSHFRPREWDFVVHRTGGRVGHRACLMLWGRKYFLPPPGIELWFVGRPVGSSWLYRLSFSGSNNIGWRETQIQLKIIETHIIIIYGVTSQNKVTFEFHTMNTSPAYSKHSSITSVVSTNRCTNYFTNPSCSVYKSAWQGRAGCRNHPPRVCRPCVGLVHIPQCRKMAARWPSSHPSVPLITWSTLLHPFWSVTLVNTIEWFITYIYVCVWCLQLMTIFRRQITTLEETTAA